MIESYLTIENVSEGIYKEKGSKFLAYAHPVNSIEQAKKLNKWYRKEYYDARHHCFAYIINPTNPQTRAADDGEPSNSAGAPILGQLKSFELTNVMVMVVRYFGGTKLGVGGLINAYRSAAKDALQHAKIIEKAVLAVYEIEFEYLQMNQVMGLIKQFEAAIIEQEQLLNCKFTLEVELKHQAEFLLKAEKIEMKIKELE